jgi:hypothetical protein
MINAIINKHLPRAFDNQLKDAVTAFTATRKGTGGAYDPELGEYVGAADINYSGRGTFGSYSTLEMQVTQIETTDVKLTALQIEVTDTPKVDDVIVVDGQDRRVMDVSQDPTKSIWILQLRGLNVG